MNKALTILFFSSFFFPAVTNAQSCDFDKVVASCTASYTLQNVRNDPNKVNTAAEIKLTSSGGACSKVTFYVDSTPYLSVFDHKNTVIEQIFGTATITNQSVSIDSCQTYAMKDDSKKDSSDDENTGDVSKLFNDAKANPNFDPTESDARFDQLIGGGAGNQAGDGSSNGQELAAFLSVLGGAAQGLSAVQAANSLRAGTAAVPMVIKTLPGAAPGAGPRQPMVSVPIQQQRPPTVTLPSDDAPSTAAP